MIEVRNLAYRYSGAEASAVEDLSFNIEDGEIFGFLGPSGAGKSTTQKVLIGLLRDYGGSISIFGKDLARWSADYYERIGVSFEVPNHYLKLTAVENLKYFAALYAAETQTPESLLAMVGLEADGDMLVSQYSKGMKNRLSIVRAILHDPELIFFDEPTVGLDPVNARRVRELIKAKRREGKTIFLTTHDMVTAEELCDRVAFIVDGRITLIGAPRELKLQHGEERVRVEYRSNGRLAQREFPLGKLGDNGEFLRLIRGENVETIHTLEATLEDVFVQVTGRELA